jgi:hypothetical protein
LYRNPIEGFEEAALQLVMRRLVLGMPLHSDEERVHGVFDAFDDLIVRVARGDEKAGPEAIDGLMVPGVYVDAGSGENVREL